MRPIVRLHSVEELVRIRDLVEDALVNLRRCTLLAALLLPFRRLRRILLPLSANKIHARYAKKLCYSINARIRVLGTILQS